LARLGGSTRFCGVWIGAIFRAGSGLTRMRLCWVNYGNTCGGGRHDMILCMVFAGMGWVPICPARSCQQVATKWWWQSGVGIERSS
jgi:hypothetical protein